MPTTETTILQNLVLLFNTLLALLLQLAELGFHWILWIIFAAICLWAINWKKARHMLAVGGWAPAVLLIVLIALVWSRIMPESRWGLANFWWQLGYVTGLGALAMFCGWLQSVFHWTPHEISFDPPAHGHGHGHDHGHAHH
jgi:hypothetical protein